MQFIAIRIRKFAPIALLLLAYAVAAQEGNPKPPVTEARVLPEPVRATIEALEKTAIDLTKDPENGSYSIAVVDKKGILWLKSFGLADVERKIAATPSTEYRIYSITKQFTALMLLQLVHDRKLRLSDPAQECFPGISEIQRLSYLQSSPITLLQLATHTSGLPIGPEEYKRGPVANWEDNLREALVHTSLVSEPGTHFKYSNIGYALLGACLAHASGATYQQYVHDHILRPLQMTHSALKCRLAATNWLLAMF
ncbi:MAG TPA: serine hydrolase domain-containing protein [Candidatus Angelobacter sp.]|jgi:CubicO group peptidase (beta-lactamase class C family)